MADNFTICVGTVGTGAWVSPDGGESWLIKEENTKPIKLKRPPPVSDWRVRPDGPTQAFQIEHRQGERWTASAAFAVKLAACKPPPEDPK